MIARDELHGNVNPQYEADHKCDEALFLDKKYIERKLDVMKYGYEREKDVDSQSDRKNTTGSAEEALCGQAGPDAVLHGGTKECLRIFDENQFSL